MRRKAILIGNTSGLEGVNIDLISFDRFLKSDHGGAWENDEIEIFKNPSKAFLLGRIGQIKTDKPDYAIVMFSGHGGQIRETILEINGNEEQIPESALFDLSQRQLNIFDCCRCVPETIEKAADSRMKLASFTESNKLMIRARYNNRIREAIPQLSRLYSCAIGQSSYDSPSGGIYLNNLINSAIQITSAFKTVGVAHEEAAGPTFLSSMTKPHGLQKPESILPKCLTSQSLIISLNPNL